MTLWDDDDDNDSPEQNMGDLTYTPMYTYVYNYRPPPDYTEVVQVSASLQKLAHVIYRDFFFS